MSTQSPSFRGTSSARPLKLGLAIPLIEGRLDGKTPRWADIAPLAQLAEDVGFDSVWLADHLIFRFGQRIGLNWRAGSWDCWSVLAALAAVTKRVQLGTLVVCTSFRNPALLARMADTVDEISGGRLILGLGAGYHEPEYRAFGFPYDHRVSRFEEALTIIWTLLREGEVDFQGAYYQARECELRPRSPSVKGPPILIGATGERMLRLTARFADLWNAWLVLGRSRPDEIRPLSAAVDAACTQAGRDPATLGRTAAVLVSPRGGSLASRRLDKLLLRSAGLSPTPLTGSPEVLAEALRSFATEGVSHVQVTLAPTSLSEIEAFARVLDILDRTPTA